MTSPRTRLHGTQLWHLDERPAMDRNALVLTAAAVWMLLVLIGLALTFS
jgi:hypothetical protein